MEESITPRDRLRAFEDRLFGPDHLRPNGEIERGIGSLFARLDAAHKAHHAALEELIAAEAAHNQAAAAEYAARTRLDTAQDRADATDPHPDQPAPAPEAEAPAQGEDASG